MKSRNKRYYIEKTLCWIRERELIRGGETVLCGLSGGADSVAMTLLLKELSAPLGIRVCAAHVNHMLRGGEAQRDEDFCRALCGERDIPFTALRGDAAALAAELGTGTEDAARELRYGLLFSLGADLVAVAHNADDNLETVIMRLVRGGGARGLSGIPPGNRNVIRPIMCLTRVETEAVCREFGADFVTDSTNLSDDCTRNIVRHRVTGELRGLNPSISERVLANSIRLREEDAFLDSLAAEKLEETGGTLSAELFERCGPVLSRRMLRIEAGRAGAEIDGEMTEKLLSLSLSGKNRFSFDVGKSAYFGEYGVFRFGKAEASEDFDFELSEENPVEIGKWRVSVQKDVFGEQKIYRIFKTFAINSDRIHGGLRVRNARSGDVFRKNAKSGSKKLGKLYSDMKLPMEVRRTLPVLADGEGVLFVPGIGQNAARDFGGTGRVLEIVFEKRVEQEQIKREEDGKMELHRDIERILLSEEQIKKRVAEIGQKITLDYGGKRPLLVSVLKGSVVFMADLMREIRVDCDIDFMSVSSYGNGQKSSGVVRILKDLDHDIAGRDIIVVEDILDSGLTLSYILDMLKKRGAASIRLCTLLDKPDRRKVSVSVDYSGFTVPDEFVVGYGLDYGETYRNLPYIGILKPEVYAK